MTALSSQIFITHCWREIKSFDKMVLIIGKLYAIPSCKVFLNVKYYDNKWLVHSVGMVGILSSLQLYLLTTGVLY